jgi:hypothetical protein
VELHSLPLGVFDIIEHDLKRSLDTLKYVEIEPDSWGAKNYYLTFQEDGGSEAVFRLIRSYPKYPGLNLIQNYDDILRQNDWINRLIMDRAQPAPNYAQPPSAAKVVEKFLASDPRLLLAFARNLLPHYKQMDNEQILSSLRWLSLIPPWSPQQICTAAYHALNQVRKQEKDYETSV